MKEFIPVKIVHVIDSLVTGGAERLVVNFARCGHDLGHDVSIVLLKKIDGIPHAIAEDSGLPVKILGTSMKDPRLLYRLRQACSAADIVHVHLFPAMYWAATLRKPKVFTEHNSQNRRMGKRMYIPFERWAYRSYDRTIVISEGVQQALEKHLDFIGYQPEISFAANGIGDDFFAVERNYSSRPRRLLKIGSLNPHKQHAIAIRAVALLDDISLTIAGDGPLRTELESLARELEIEDRIHFLGNVKDVPAVLKEHDLLLCTSAYEGMSTVVIEAQATGIPVVGADVAGVREFVAHNETGVLYPGTDPQVVAAAVERALSPDLYPKLCSRTRDFVSQYTIENSFKSQLAIYRDILSRY